MMKASSPKFQKQKLVESLKARRLGANLIKLFTTVSCEFL
jgi:hypothetical protein